MPLESPAAGQLRKLIEQIEGGARVELGRVASACTAARRRAEFLEQLAGEVRSWPLRGLVLEADASRIEAALRAERLRLEELIRHAAAARPRPAAIPVARLVPPPPAPPVPVPVLSEAAALPRAVENEPAREPKAPAEPEAPPAAPAIAPPAPAAPRPPWYTEERNLRILANLGILVFNVGLVGFITSAWDRMGDATKVAVLAGYTALLLAGGLAIRQRTRLLVTGSALLALGVLAVPIDFFAVHYYHLTELSRSTVGLAGSGACLAVALGVAFLTRESLFFWVAYLAGVFGGCYLCDGLGLAAESWPGALLPLFGAYLALDRLAVRKRWAPESALGRLAAPARAVSAAGAALATAAHLVFWLGTGDLDPAARPAGVIVPLAFMLAYFLALAALRGSGRLMVLPALVEALILLAALQAAKTPGHEWPIAFMVLGATAVTVCRLLWARLGRAWLFHHLAVGCALAALSLAAAGLAFLWEAAGVWAPDSGPSGLACLMLTAAPALLAAAVLAARTVDALPAALLMPLALLECALLLRHSGAAWCRVPVSCGVLGWAGLALTLAALRRPGRERQLRAFEITAHLGPAAGALCLAARPDLFWEAAPARWGLLFALSAAALYGAWTFFGRRAAVPALAAYYAALLLLGRSLSCDWTALGAVLAGGALVSAVGLDRRPRLRDAAAWCAHLAGVGALGLAVAVYAVRPERTFWAMAAVGLVGALHLHTAVSRRLAGLEYSGLALAGTAAVLAARECGLADARLGLAALALPAAFHALGAAARRLGWRSFAESPRDLAAAGAAAALGLTLAAGGAGRGGGLVAPVILALGLPVLFLGLAAWRNAPGDARSISAARGALEAAALVAAAALQVAWRDETLWPELALLAVAGFHLAAALGRRERSAEYTCLAMLAAAYLLIFPEVDLDARLYGPVAAALPPAFYGLSFLARFLRWRAFRSSFLDMAAVSCAAVLALTVFPSLEGTGLVAAVAGAGLAGAAWLAVACARGWPGAPAAGHCGAAALAVAAAGIQVLREDVAVLPWAWLAVMGALQALAGRRRRLAALGHSALLLFGAAYLLALYDSGMAGRLARPAAAALPAGFCLLSAIAARLSWRRLAEGAMDMVLPAVAAALAVSLAGRLSWVWLGPAAALTALAVAVWTIAAARAGAGQARTAMQPPAAALLLAAAAVQVWRGDLFLAPAAAAAALGAVQAWLATRRRAPALEYAALLLLGGAGLLALKDVGPDPAWFRLSMAALPILFCALSLLARRLGWRAWGESAFDLAVPASAAALLAAMGPELEPVPMWLAVLAAAGLGAPWLALAARGELPGLRAAGHLAAAAMLAAAAALEVWRGGLGLLPAAAVAAMAALQAGHASARRTPALEYGALGLAAAACILALKGADVPLHRYCLAVAALSTAFFALSLEAHRRSWRAFASSSFDMALPAGAAALTLALLYSMGGAPERALWYRAELWSAVGAAALLAATCLTLSWTDNPRSRPGPALFSLAGSALAALAYLLVLRVFSTGTPYRALWIMGITPALLAYGLALELRGQAARGRAALGVSMAVTGLALWQALLFPDKPLVAALAFAVASAMCGLSAALLGSAWFGAAAAAAFTVAYFSMLRRLGVPASHYVLWLAVLGLLQSLVGGLSWRGARQRRPAMFVGMLLAAGAVTWMVWHGDAYLDRSGDALNAAIWTTLCVSAIFAAVAWLRRSLAAAYPAAAALVGSYYLVLHRFEVGYLELYTVPVALLVLAWAGLVVWRSWGARSAAAANWVGLALALVPPLALSLDRGAPRHLGHMLAAFGLAVLAVLAGMAYRRKAYLFAGAGAFAIEGLVKLVHFKIRYAVTDWVWLLLVGLALIGFVLYAETRRNARLKARADEAREKLRRFFDGWK